MAIRFVLFIVCIGLLQHAHAYGRDDWEEKVFIYFLFCWSLLLFLACTTFRVFMGWLWCCHCSSSLQNNFCFAGHSYLSW